MDLAEELEEEIRELFDESSLEEEDFEEFKQGLLDLNCLEKVANLAMLYRTGKEAFERLNAVLKLLWNNPMCQLGNR